MKIKNTVIDKLIPYDKNPRINNESIGHVVSSIREFGFQQPIVVDKNWVVIIGHTRLQAAKVLKLEKVPVHVADYLSIAKVKALRLADNKTGEKSFWDVELLREEVGDLKELEFDTDLEEFGFESFETNPVFEDPSNSGEEPDESDLPPARNPTKDSLKIIFDDPSDKIDAFTILGVDPSKKAVDWEDVKRALNL